MIKKLLATLWIPVAVGALLLASLEPRAYNQGMLLRGVLPDDATSNTALICKFFSPFIDSTEVPWDATTKTMWYLDGTSAPMYRARVVDELTITNLTTHTAVYVTVNAGLQVVGTPDSLGNRPVIWNETTPTLNTTAFQYILGDVTSTHTRSITIDPKNSPHGAVYNVGLYFYDGTAAWETAAAFRSRVTSSTAILIGR